MILKNKTYKQQNTNYILLLAIVLYLFLSTSVARVISIEQVGSTSSFLFVLIFLPIFFKLNGNKLLKIYKEEITIILIASVIIFIKVFLGQVFQINAVIFILIIPMFISIIMGQQDYYNRTMCRNIILFFFILECILAIWERISLINLFPYEDELDYILTIEEWSFRSSAFLGHPLSNALAVSSIMGFILISSINPIVKPFYLLLGFISLLCFNARAAILIWILIALIYFYNFIRTNGTNLKSILLVFICIGGFFYFFYTLIIDLGFGGRLIQSEVLDGSAQTRLGVYDAFSYINNYDLWFGDARNYIPVMKKLGAGGVENSYIVLIIQYGVVPTIILFFLYYKLIKRYFKNYTFYQKSIILISFIIAGSTNNGLVSATIWGVFILCIYSFSTDTFSKRIQLK